MELNDIEKYGVKFLQVSGGHSKGKQWRAFKGMHAHMVYEHSCENCGRGSTPQEAVEDLIK